MKLDKFVRKVPGSSQASSGQAVPITVTIITKCYNMVEMREIPQGSLGASGFPPYFQ